MKPPTHPEPTSAEFILRVRVPIEAADRLQSHLVMEAALLKGRLSRVERADYPDYSIHVRRKRLV